MKILLVEIQNAHAAKSKKLELKDESGNDLTLSYEDVEKCVQGFDLLSIPARGQVHSLPWEKQVTLLKTLSENWHG